MSTTLTKAANYGSRPITNTRSTEQGDMMGVERRPMCETANRTKWGQSRYTIKYRFPKNGRYAQFTVDRKLFGLAIGGF